MYRGSRSVLIAALAVFLLAPGGAIALEAGAAKMELVVNPGTPLDGFARRMGRGAVEAHDSLWVRALYVETDDTALFLVSADLFSITPALRERVLDLVPEEASNAHVILTATHTHNGPGGLSASWLGRQRAGRFIPEFLEQTAGSFGQVMRLAYEARIRAVTGYAVTDVDSLTENAYSPKGPTDTQLGVIRVEDSDGAPIAILANVGALPATVSDDHAYVLSADFPGRFCDALEEKMDSEAIAFFLNGASGDQVPTLSDAESDWDQAESFGASLATRVQKLSKSIQCREPKLSVSQSEPTLPRAIDDRESTRTAIFQTLEIDGLLVSFIPGVAYAEVGLALREQAKARGYDVHMSVGPANGFEGSFISYASYGANAGEEDHTRFGPAIGDWVSEQVAALMMRGEHSLQEPEPLPEVKTAEFSGRQRITLRSGPYAHGHQRGQAFHEEIRRAYEGLVLEPLRDGSIGTKDTLRHAARAGIDIAPLAISALANRMRPLMAGLSKEDLQEIQGLADATNLPFLAIWLLQTQAYFAEGNRAHGSSSQALFAVTEGRAGAEGLLVGHAFEEGMFTDRHVFDVRPESGRSYLTIGPAWDLGVRSGMNDAGLVVSIQRATDLGQPGFDAPPIGLVARTILTSQDDFEDAVQALRAFDGLRGYRVLIAARAKSEGESQAAVIEFGDEVVVRKSEDGLLISGLSESGETIAEYLAGESALDIDRVQSALRYSRDDHPADPNRKTRIVFEPQAYRAHIGFRNANGAYLPYEALVLSGDRP